MCTDLDLVTVVEGVPELGDDEEIFSLDQAFFDGSCYTLTSFLLISVV